MDYNGKITVRQVVSRSRHRCDGWSRLMAGRYYEQLVPDPRN